ncbi:hypothetical protein [Agrobacterium sp. DSM 25558]|uniref:hypothetical protein n=1 Tax=Agrobacterium sp. DSM 25558 TaxID=1907665 RepID=UPI00190ED22A|nr:hypothetical protein [Agrobacterium sp. DSM 25558]
MVKVVVLGLLKILRIVIKDHADAPFLVALVSEHTRFDLAIFICLSWHYSQQSTGDLPARQIRDDADALTGASSSSFWPLLDDDFTAKQIPETIGQNQELVSLCAIGFSPC